MSEQQIVEIFRDWLNRGQAGCYFASHAAANAHLSYTVRTTDELCDQDITDITAEVDQIAKARHVALLLFPKLTRTAQLAQLVASFARHPRWSVTDVPHPQSAETAAVGISLETATGEQSIAMGFAPTLDMPVTRRAPYVALALWAGPRSNPYFDKGAPGKVNMAHAWHDLPADSHQNMWDRSKAATKLRLVQPPFKPRWLYDVSFCLPQRELDEALAARR